MPRSFGDKCFGIPENCQNCNEVVDCEAGSGPQPTPGQRAGQGRHNACISFWIPKREAISTDNGFIFKEINELKWKG